MSAIRPEADRTARYTPIREYAIIGDCRSAALVSSSGSIDWCCWPRYDSPAFLARLLDHDRGGFFAITPTVPFRTRRRYLGSTNVLETTFVTADGELRLLDLMPVFDEEEKKKRFIPFRQILRRVDCVRGEVPVSVVLELRPHFGMKSFRLRKRAWGTVCDADSELWHLRSTLDIDPGSDRIAKSFVMKGGDRHDFAFAYDTDGPAIFPHVGDAASADIDASLEFWNGWSSRLRYDGPFRRNVERSALTLKLLAFAPSGAIVAAPTTSLPEAIGAERNWDYRFCWLRDASFTVRALYDLGCREEGDAYVEWLLDTTSLSHPELRVLYDIYGNSLGRERVLEGWEGYAFSSPVRIGNAAANQFQLDVYGEVFAAIDKYLSGRDYIDRDHRRLVIDVANFVANSWRDADEGIWEMRSGRWQHIHGKALAWAALDCASRIVTKFGIRAPVDVWAREKDAIRKFVEREGFNESLGTFTRIAGGSSVDASLLRMSLVGFIDADDPRMVKTIAAIERELRTGDLVYRYRGIHDALGGNEGAFLACSFWLVENIAYSGDEKRALALFEELLQRENDVGLLAEEIDPESGEFLGNFPQGFSHLALINAALTLEHLSKQKPGEKNKGRA